jgi:integrase
MAKAGVASGTLHEKAGKYGRKVAERSFHSLRHSYVTALSAAGVLLSFGRNLRAIQANREASFTLTQNSPRCAVQSKSCQG